MKVIALASLALFAVACGPQATLISATTAEECVTGLMLTTGCSTPSAAPTPTPTPVASTLTITGSSPASTASWLSLGFSRVPSSSLTGWQTHGASNATPIVKVFPVSNLNVSGNCSQVDLKVQTSTGAPAGLQGTFNNQGQAYRFVYCIENGEILAKYEDGGDSNFNDYSFRIKSSVGPLNYQVVGVNLLVCLD